MKNTNMKIQKNKDILKIKYNKELIKMKLSNDPSYKKFLKKQIKTLDVVDLYYEYREL